VNAANADGSSASAREPLRPPSQFPCAQCGALQAYSPGTRDLTCPYCGHVTAIPEDAEPIRELPLRDALATLQDAPAAGTSPVVQCRNCAAEFSFDANVHAGNCPFCGAPIVTGTGAQRHIKPRSLLPFRIDEDAARAAYQRWLRRLWFAPRAVELTGVYLPYWTYDAMTRSSYTGERGDAYYVQLPYTTTVNGRRVTRIRNERRIRWTPVRGGVSRLFDDVLVGASESLPRQITDRLAPWDLAALVPYDERYLSGFRSEVYQVGLDQGFQRALQIMAATIRDDVTRDIGGDAQRIHDVQTSYSEQTFKHVLLPIWSAAFRYRKRSYRFVVNGRSGKVQGERPYSPWKIAAAVIGGIILLVAVIVLLQHSGALDQLQNGY
jgi:ribosomal protein S27E